MSLCYAVSHCTLLCCGVMCWFFCVVLVLCFVVAFAVVVACVCFVVIIANPSCWCVGHAKKLIILLCWLLLNLAVSVCCLLDHFCIAIFLLKKLFFFFRLVLLLRFLGLLIFVKHDHRSSMSIYSQLFRHYGPTINAATTSNNALQYKRQVTLT